MQVSGPPCGATPNNNQTCEIRSNTRHHALSGHLPEMVVSGLVMPELFQFTHVDLSTNVGLPTTRVKQKMQKKQMLFGNNTWLGQVPP